MVQQLYRSIAMKYFTIKELTTSSTATRLNIDNTPTEEVVNNLESLVNNILDKIREAYGKPITDTLCLRYPIPNSATPASKTTSTTASEPAAIISTNTSI